MSDEMTQDQTATEPEADAKPARKKPGPKPKETADVVVEGDESVTDEAPPAEEDPSRDSAPNTPIEDIFNAPASESLKEAKLAARAAITMVVFKQLLDQPPVGQFLTLNVAGTTVTLEDNIPQEVSVEVAEALYEYPSELFTVEPFGA